MMDRIIDTCFIAFIVVASISTAVMFVACAVMAVRDVLG